MSNVELQVKTNAEGRDCWADNCYQRFAINGGRDGYVVRGTAPDTAVAAAITTEHGAPGPGEFDMWLPPPVIEG